MDVHPEKIMAARLKLKGGWLICRTRKPMKQRHYLEIIPIISHCSQTGTIGI
ncbi:hypothetical protein [Legionella geestiana]|uniref:hypothetical protein n=1 Tax=Legionella geestiana TaxID=45065 RepID=UPI00165247DB|nr:hypothetical protein [Legionella geestiana]